MKFLIFFMVLLIAGSLTASRSLPENGFIVFASNRSGAWRIWRMEPGGNNPVQLSGDSHEAVMPTISPDGKWVAYRNGRESIARDIWLMRPDGSGARLAVADAAITHLPIAPAWGTGGFFYQKDNVIFFLDPHENRSEAFHDLSGYTNMRGCAFNFHGMTHDHRWIVGHTNRYQAGFKGSNGWFKEGNAAAILDMHDKEAVYFFGAGCEPTTPPRGGFVYHVGGKAWPNTDIYKIEAGKIATREGYSIEIGYPDARWGHEYFPRVSNDNRWLVYSASQGGHDHYSAQYEIFIHRLGEPDHRVRLTDNPATDNWPHLWVGDAKREIAGKRLRGRSREAIHIRVNAGGNLVDGWRAQDGYVDGKSGNYVASQAVSTDGVENAAPAALYRTCRHRNPVFTFPATEVPPGRYRVRFHCAEPHFSDCAQARRNMRIRIADVVVEDHFNPCAAAGGCHKAVVREYDVDVRDGNGMSIALDGGERDAFVMGIEILNSDRRR